MKKITWYMKKLMKKTRRIIREKNHQKRMDRKFNHQLQLIKEFNMVQ